LRLFEDLFWGERADKGVVEVTARYGFYGSPVSTVGGRIAARTTWAYPKDAVDHERFTNFIDLAHRQIEAVAFSSPGVQASAGAGIADQLERVVALRQLGHISEQELEQAKRRILFG